MSNYTPTGAPAAKTRGSSSVIRNELDAISAAVNSKADYSGQTYSGIHNYTAATLRAATPVNGSDVATMSFVQSVVFSGIGVSVPPDAGPYSLTASNGVLNWTLASTFTNPTLLAQAQAISLCF